MGARRPARPSGPPSRSYYVDPASPEGAPPADGTEWDTSFGGAGGALVSTPADVDRFLRGLFGGRLLPARRLAEMKRTVPADPELLWPGARYGLGLVAGPLECGGWWWGHGGTLPGGHRSLAAVGPGGRAGAASPSRSTRSPGARRPRRTTVPSRPPRSARPAADPTPLRRRHDRPPNPRTARPRMDRGRAAGRPPGHGRRPRLRGLPGGGVRRDRPHRPGRARRSRRRRRRHLRVHVRVRCR
ncbi:serine hydrolase [Kitasatospora sp. RG8]|uniref:serine hydrolase n=1 Tax=Kitasatospora sp. RG8 TaxID=2820815 RepID=UPI0035A8216E